MTTTDYLAEMRDALGAAKCFTCGSANEAIHRRSATAYALASLAESLATIATNLPQGPAETGTPLADTPAPAEPPVFVEALPWATYVSPKPPQGSAAPPTANGVEGAGAGLTEPVPTPAESSLAALNAAEEALLALLSWRDLDKVSEGDAIDEGVMRLRDEADRIAGLMRVAVAS